jgi:hypothetical protein
MASMPHKHILPHSGKFCLLEKKKTKKASRKFILLTGIADGMS